MIELNHISKDFGSGPRQVHAVRDVSLSIEKREIFGIIGFSGAGKSTLVRCMNLLERPTAGTVTVNGQELTALPAKELRQARKKIGMIFQHFNLMPSRTVFGNVAYPLRNSGLSKGEIREKVQKLLDLVEIGDKADAYPRQLSGGQTQRVAVARALANDPSVLLCDEATSALDPQTTKAILRLIKRLNETLGITVVVITHEMAVVKEICGRVAVMEQGRVVEQGEVFSIFAKPREPVTRSFVHTTSNLQKIEELIAQNSPLVRLKPGELIVRLNYVERSPSEPVISEASLRYGVVLNIIFADIEIIQGAPIGGTVAIISGEREKVTAAVNYLIEKNVGVEVLKDARDAMSLPTRSMSTSSTRPAGTPTSPRSPACGSGPSPARRCPRPTPSPAGGWAIPSPRRRSRSGSRRSTTSSPWARRRPSRRR